MILPSPPTPPPFRYQFGQHDVTERQAEQQAQRIEQPWHGQRHEDFKNDLQARSAEREGGIDVAAADIGDRRGRIHHDERDDGDENEHHLLRLADSEQRERQRDQRRDRNVAAEHIDRGKEGIDPGKAAAEHAKRNRDGSGQQEAEHHAPQADEQVPGQRIAEPQVVSCSRLNVSAGLGSEL